MFPRFASPMRPALRGRVAVAVTPTLVLVIKLNSAVELEHISAVSRFGETATETALSISIILKF